LARTVHTLAPARMLRREICDIPDFAIDDYPAVFWRVVFRDLLD
jgi:hypothetical protein